MPTRDRPDLLAFCLEGLAAQTFGDVEVVVADNPVHAPGRDVFESSRKQDWRYVRAPEPLSMADNWEFGMGHVTGDFIAVLSDKWILHPSAFELVRRALEDDPAADLVSWWNDDYLPAFRSEEVGKGRFIATRGIRAPARFDPEEELRKMFLFEQRRNLDRIHKCRGKIYYGVYSRELVERIRDCCGRLFYPVSPDYTSAVPALALTRGAIDMGRPLLLTHSGLRSNGVQTVRPAYAKSFVLESDATALGRLPIPGLYASSHNIVAFDVVTSARRLPPETAPELNRPNLVRRAREDLELAIWDSAAEREAQYGILEAEEARLGVTPDPSGVRREGRLQESAVAVLQRVPPAHRAARRIHRRLFPPSPEQSKFDSPAAAAFAADRHYAALASGTTSEAD